MSTEPIRPQSTSVVNPEKMGGIPADEPSLREMALRMYRLIYGNWQTCVTFAFAELALADLLYGAPRTVEDLAAATATQPAALKRFLRCAATLGFVRTAGEPGVYALTPFGGLLRSDHPHSQRAAARLNGEDYRYQPWGRLIEVLRTGDSRDVSPTYNSTLDYLADKPEQLEVFHHAMTDLSAGQNEALAEAYDFSRHQHMMDLGGGEGFFVLAVLDANPHLRGTVFDLSATQRAGSPADRLERRAGDFFAAVPADADLYSMKNVLHNWSEEKALLLLSNVRTAMLSTAGDVAPADKRLLVVEHLIPEGDGFSVAKWLDLNFLIIIRGAERTLEEYRDLARRAGFELLRALPTASGRHILELALAADGGETGR